MSDMGDDVQLGRPTKLTPDRAEKIVALVEKGNFLGTAANATGVGKRTVMRWLARGKEVNERLNAGEPIKESDEPYWHFWHKVRVAEGTAESTALAAIWDSMPRNPHMAAWYLERKKPAKWNRRAPVQLEPSQNFLNILATAITTEDIEQVEPPPHAELRRAELPHPEGPQQDTSQETP